MGTDFDRSVEELQQQVIDQARAFYSDEEASEVRPQDLLEALDGLPEENAHCAELAVSTLQNALLNWRVEQDGLLDG